MRTSVIQAENTKLTLSHCISENVRLSPGHGLNSHCFQFKPVAILTSLVVFISWLILTCAMVKCYILCFVSPLPLPPPAVQMAFDASPFEISITKYACRQPVLKNLNITLFKFIIKQKNYDCH